MLPIRFLGNIRYRCTGGPHVPQYIGSLGDHFVSFIDAQVKGGHYGSASDMVRAGLRLLEEHETRVKALQDALIAGEDSGRAEGFDLDQFIARKMAGRNA